MSTSLIIAIPSCGHMRDNALAFLASAGLDLVYTDTTHNHFCTIKGLDHVGVVFLPASEIAGQLATGAIHFGIIGEDLLREQLADADAVVEFLSPLGFGQADVVIAVPQAWIDVQTVADLDDVATDMRQRYGRRLRVATRYASLTRRFFAAQGVSDYSIVESLGATSGAPAAGAAEVIVDITSADATFAAHALKVIDDGVILHSQANLVASIAAPWSRVARNQAAMILARITAQEEARNIRELVVATTCNGPTLDQLCERYGASRPFGFSDSRGHETFHCPAERAFSFANDLISLGAEPVIMRSVGWVLRRSNPLMERLIARIG